MNIKHIALTGVVLLGLVGTGWAQDRRRNEDKAVMGTLGAGLGAAALNSLVHGRVGDALVLGAGAAYSGKKYEDARKAQRDEDRYGWRDRDDRYDRNDRDDRYDRSNSRWERERRERILRERIERERRERIERERREREEREARLRWERERRDRDWDRDSRWDRDRDHDCRDHDHHRG